MEQAQLWAADLNNHQKEWYIAVGMLTFLGADLGPVRFCCSSERYLDADDLRRWASRRNEIVAFYSLGIQTESQEESTTFWDRATRRRVVLANNVLIIESGGQYGDRTIFDTYRPHLLLPETASEAASQSEGRRWYERSRGTIEGYALEVIAKEWGMEFGTILDQLTDVDRYGSDCPIGQLDDGTAYADSNLYWRVRRSRIVAIQLV